MQKQEIPLKLWCACGLLYVLVGWLGAWMKG